MPAAISIISDNSCTRNSITGGGRLRHNKKETIESCVVSLEYVIKAYEYVLRLWHMASGLRARTAGQSWRMKKKKEKL